MIEINSKSKNSIISEEHFYTIKFGLEDALKIYKNEVEQYNKMNYLQMTGEQIHIMKWYENKIFDTEELLKELESVQIVKTSNKNEEYIKVSNESEKEQMNKAKEGNIKC